MVTEIAQRLASCETSQRRLRALFVLQTLLLACCIVFIAIGQANASRPAESMRLKELVIVDADGVPRVRISGDVPDAVVQGRVVPRGDKAAGVILYDDTGQERGGYVTFDASGNVALTLDTRQRQATLFVAGPDTGSALALWHGKDKIELRSDGEGSRLTTVQAGRVIEQRPEVARIDAEGCGEYRKSLGQFGRDEVLGFCRQRYTDTACNACMAEPAATGDPD
ncbi:hypothetical protein [Arenimonas sp.]|uniref:hypothetical protein n=1 Tax=Arenimonas sp. TaxID=1872635 RepID=UPI0039E36113